MQGRSDIRRRILINIVVTNHKVSHHHSKPIQGLRNDSPFPQGKAEMGGFRRVLVVQEGSHKHLFEECTERKAEIHTLWNRRRVVEAKVGRRRKRARGSPKKQKRLRLRCQEGQHQTKQHGGQRGSEAFIEDALGRLGNAKVGTIKESQTRTEMCDRRPLPTFPFPLPFSLLSCLPLLPFRPLLPYGPCSVLVLWGGSIGP